jgi:U6 snRNA-associated Sm-like protein LSm1
MEIDNYLPGSASLVDYIDTKLYILLRDGRNYIGYLRSYDQFANLVLMDSQEIIEENDKIFKKELGIQLVRGENVVLIGQVDDDGDQEQERMTKEEAKSALERQNKEKEEKRVKLRELIPKGFSVEHIIGDNY